MMHVQARLVTFALKSPCRFASIVMSPSKHLKAGSQCPPLAENQLRLYGMRFCPYVQRAKLVLAAKQIPYEEINVNLVEKPDWYLARNAPGQVPSLEWIDPETKETKFIPESLVVCDYLEETNREVQLYPADAYAKAQQRILVERFSSVTTAFYRILRGDAQKGIEDMNQNLLNYEQALKGTFFNGSKPGMVDYMLWPWFERLPLLTEKGFVFNENGRFPKLEAWIAAMNADENVQKVKVPEELMKKFMQGYVEGKVEYDFD